MTRPDVRATDGYRVEVADTPRLEIRLILRHDGFVAPEHTWSLFEREDTLEHRGAWERTANVWRALATYMNCGGDIDHLAWSIRNLTIIVGLPAIDLSPLVLMNTVQPEEPVAQHFFFEKESNKVLVWEEDGFVEYRTLDDLKRIADEREDVDSELYDI